MARPGIPLLRREPGAGIGPAAPGDAPADGDFARLLEAASRPSAHRLGIDPALSGVGDGRVAVRSGPWRDRAAPAVDAAAPGIDQDAGDAVPRPAAAQPSVPGGTRDGPGVFGMPARSPGPARPSAARSPGLFAGRSLRERLVGIAVVIAVVWTLAVMLGRAMDAPDDTFGLLIVLGFVAFLVLRGRLRRRRD